MPRNPIPPSDAAVRAEMEREGLDYMPAYRRLQQRQHILAHEAHQRRMRADAAALTYAEQARSVFAVEHPTPKQLIYVAGQGGAE